MAVHQSVCPQPQLPPGEHLVAVNGVKLHCIVSGRGPLLVVQAPGWGIGSAYLRNGLAPVEDQFTLLFYDPRGSGKSTRPTSETQMSTSDMVEDLEQMRRYWGLKSINVLGHSNGGSIALGYAERYPDHLEKLIVVNSCPPGFDASATVRQFINRRKDDIRYVSSIESLEQPVPKNDDQFQKYIGAVWPFYFYDPHKNVPAFLETTTVNPSSWAYHASAASDRLEPQRPSETLAAIRATTLILVGSEDPFCSFVVADQIHQGLQRSKLVVLREAGHFLWIEQPRDFFGIIEEFLQQNI
jgi:proline iminopeptidase